jgi:hypothetical protein
MTWGRRAEGDVRHILEPRGQRVGERGTADQGYRPGGTGQSQPGAPAGPSPRLMARGDVPRNGGGDPG